MTLSLARAGSTPNWRYTCRQVIRCGARRGKVRYTSQRYKVEAEGGPLERRQGVQVERYGVLDDLVEELLTQFDLAVPQ